MNLLVMSTSPDIQRFCAELVRIDASGMSQERIVLATGFSAAELHEFRMSSEYLAAQAEYVRLRALVGIETQELSEDVIHRAMRHARSALGDPNVDGDYALRAAAVAHRLTKATGVGRGAEMAVNINAPQGVIVMQLPPAVAATIRGVDAARIAAQAEHAASATKYVGMTTSSHMKEFLGLNDTLQADDAESAEVRRRVSKVARAGEALLAMVDSDADVTDADVVNIDLPPDVSALL